MSKTADGRNATIAQLKRRFYFQVAEYFAGFARKRLAKWSPRIVVVTGSEGKTTAFNLLESQLGQKAKYSYHANSAFGVPFDILGLERHNYHWYEWLGLFWKAPWQVDKPLPRQSIYVVECDCDRPGEGEFLADLLKPEFLYWVGVSGTHAMNFESLVAAGKFKNVEEAVAYEFGWFLTTVKEQAVVNGDSALVGKQLVRVNKGVKVLTLAEKDYLVDYEINRQGTTYKFKGATITVPELLPKDAWRSVVFAQKMSEVFGVNFDEHFRRFQVPPGRSGIWPGIRGVTLIDSVYNSSPAAMRAMLRMFSEYQTAGPKWVVLADMIELGGTEQAMHESLVEPLEELQGLKRVILLGPRMKKYLAPKLSKLGVPVMMFEKNWEVLMYLVDNLTGSETVLFKGSRFMEGMIEVLMANPADAQRLVKRGPVWEKRRNQFLPMDRARALTATEQNIPKERELQSEAVIKRATRKSKYATRKKVFILPGWTTDDSKWAPLVKELSRADYLVKLLPIPGLTGEPLPRAWKLDDYVAWLMKILAKEKEVYAIGHSNGGRILIAAAAKFPAKFEKIILIDSAGLIDQRWQKKMKRSVFKTLAKTGTKVGLKNEKNQALLHRASREQDYAAASPIMKETMSNLIEQDLSDELREMGAQTLLIWGESDQQTPLFMGQQMLQLIPRATLRIIPEARHSPQFTQTETVLAEIEDFLAQRTNDF